MSIQGRIHELHKRHRELDVTIASELQRPAHDDIRLQNLKRQKLRIKEELVNLQAKTA
jgi:hypothetical protein